MPAIKGVREGAAEPIYSPKCKSSHIQDGWFCVNGTARAASDERAPRFSGPPPPCICWPSPLRIPGLPTERGERRCRLDWCSGGNLITWLSGEVGATDTGRMFRLRVVI